MADIDTTRYPVGPLPRIREPLGDEARAQHIAIIESAPEKLRSLLAGRAAHDLELRYRSGGWTVKQIVHHIADSHINAYVRMKLAATEELPTVKSWEQTAWAELPEARTAAVEISLALIEALHRRWVAFLRGLRPSDFRRAFKHYEWGEVTIEEFVVMYSWHCRHHTEHIAMAFSRRI